MDLNGLAVDLGFLYMGVEKVDYHFCVESRSEIVDDTVLAVLLCFAAEYRQQRQHLYCSCELEAICSIRAMPPQSSVSRCEPSIRETLKRSMCRACVGVRVST